MKQPVLIALFFLSSTFCFGQYKENYKGQSNKKSTGQGDWLDKVFVQPGLGLSFGAGGAYVNVGLTVGYKVTERLSAGVGANYIYTKIESDIPSTPDLRSDTWGGNLFSRYILIGPLFAAAQYEFMSIQYSGFVNEKLNYDAFLLGGGILQKKGNIGVFIQLLYNLNYDDDGTYRDNGPYTSPYVFSAGLMVGF
ncbi:hypothetical protein [Reichenbachiella versicolor]|uniref:hypothetical protein n=1 Tax=Reichenbachiella versicolor TaxID=1821036 RepID=UPI0013A5724E|nr:hypothetical protein [Reichenbachiella versicolor]